MSQASSCEIEFERRQMRRFEHLPTLNSGDQRWGLWRSRGQISTRHERLGPKPAARFRTPKVEIARLEFGLAVTQLQAGTFDIGSTGIPAEIRPLDQLGSLRIRAGMKLAAEKLLVNRQPQDVSLRMAAIFTE